MSTRDEYPVLKIRANGPLPPDVTEVTLGGVDLLPFGVTHVELSMGPNRLTTATITLHVTPDVETPVEANI
jgi:hypothetical protein